ncbi:probable FBD-associated F-box protein At1g32375 isoform X2 [Coffea eugenioides]|uniref:probable FBD-associated F-box protein At1g32375 isoform X2 n=1 Tax=Coffea eugenioides TaxID=49369 RepID=UPI000F6074F5|nr:probable FBD-associated F-box protein At1g32375 isoform X2 [Coffea eugenioides]
MENPSQKRLTLSSEMDAGASVDRISSLPDSVLCYILSFLPTTKYAVGTSILSKRWKFLWTGVPYLLFDDDRVRKSPERVRKFEQFVNKVLLLSTVQNILKFRLCCGNELIEPFYVNAWISTAIIRNVRVLKVVVFDYRRADVVIELPSCLFTCRTLEDLELWDNLDINTPNLVCLPRLKRLTLSYVQYRNDESVGKLISGCPILEFLDISRYGFDNVTVFVISSPSLKQLRFRGNDDFPENLHYKVAINTPALESLDYSNHIWQHIDVNFQNITSLVRAKIDVEAFPGDDPPQSGFCNSLVELVQALHGVKILTLSQETMKALSYATTRLSTRRFEGLTKLVVRAGCCEWTCLQDLVEVAVNLEVLDFTKAINLDAFDMHKNWHREHTTESCWRDPIEVPRCLITSLKQISFEELEGFEDELAMIGYILKHGSVLNRMHLSSKVGGLSTKFQLTQKVLLFPRRSPTCQIAFCGKLDHGPFSASHSPMGET